MVGRNEGGEEMMEMGVIRGYLVFPGYSARCKIIKPITLRL
jgi:hypothetical protein